MKTTIRNQKIAEMEKQGFRVVENFGNFTGMVKSKGHGYSFKITHVIEVYDNGEVINKEPKK